MQSFNTPLMMMGGGGYKIINVARCWAAETGVAVGAEMSGECKEVLAMIAWLGLLEGLRWGWWWGGGRPPLEMSGEPLGGC